MTTLKVAVHQPNYIPWCGYFAKMMESDIFVFLDDVQLPRGRSWVSRTKIASGPSGDRWLTVPIRKRGSPKINEVLIADPDWADRHLLTIHHEYGRSDRYSEALDLILPVLRSNRSILASVNQALIEAISRYLGWGGIFKRASAYPSALKSDSRIAELVRAVGGSHYVSGGGARNTRTLTPTDAMALS